MVNKIYFILAAALCMAFALRAQSVEVKAKTDKSDYKVGDYVHYTITAVHDEALKPEAPSIKDSLKGAELIRNASVTSEVKDGKTLTRFEYIVSAYDSADITIPPIPVLFSGKGHKGEQLLTNKVTFAVRTLKVEAETDIRDVKEPIRIPIDWKTVLLWVLLALVLIAIAAYAYTYYRKRKMLKGLQPVYVRKEPHEAALEALGMLETKKLWQSGQIREYHSEITEIIRRYFEDRFNIPALEMTTGELTERLKTLSGASHVAPVCSDFLNNADLVKFARFVPMNNVNEEMLQQAYSIVKSTIPQAEAQGNSSLMPGSEFQDGVDTDKRQEAGNVQ